jgi:hypothetical protein
MDVKQLKERLLKLGEDRKKLENELVALKEEDKCVQCVLPY